MNVTLEALLQSVGETVQRAQTHLERTAETLYWSHFTQQDDGACRPISQRLELPLNAVPGAATRVLEVPVVALYRHQTMALHTVEMHLHFLPQMGENGLELELQPPGNARSSEMHLTFQGQEAAEGTARLDCTAAQLLP